MSVSSPDVRLEDDCISVGRFFSVDFQRTVRLPDDGRKYLLPPGLGSFPLRCVSEFAGRVPATWLERGGFLLPMHRHEALWLSFGCPFWHPVAVRVEVGGVCALTGAHRVGGLSASPQNYMVAGDQPWLDGIKAEGGLIRQFVAAPLREGVTVEAQVTGGERLGGIQLTVVEPKAGRFPEAPPPRFRRWAGAQGDVASSPVAYLTVREEPVAMGLGAGGRMVQKIYPDPYGIDTWDAGSAVCVQIHLVDARDWFAITGEEAPRSPISIETYKALGLPWFAVSDPGRGDVPVARVLAEVKPIAFD
jgi:hypothetical protein